jgi:Carboxypeptidase regulatory-like domain
MGARQHSMKKTIVSTFLTCAFCLVPFALLHAQPQSLASISGIVVTDGATPQVVRRAVVRLSGSGLGRDRGAITDESGHFSFAGLPAGRFTITAAKPSFISTAYGAKRAGRPGTPLTLTAGQQVSDLKITLWRGAVITGTVRDVTGEPAANAQVIALRADQLSAPPTSVVSSDFSTDNRGVYRIFGLAPGDYLVVASGGARTGDLAMLSSRDIDVALQELETIRTGRGTAGVPRANRLPNPTAELRPGPRFTLAPTYYPGTPTPSEAVKITLAAGDERNADLTLSFSRTAIIEGVVSNPGGSLPGVTLALTPEGPQLPFTFQSSPTLAVRPDTDGTFRYTGVAPGKYTLSARSGGPAGNGAGGGGRGGAGVVSPPPPSTSSSTTMLWATADLVVTGDDLQGIALVLQPGLKLRGRVRFDALTMTPPADLTTLRVNLAIPDVNNSSVVMNGVQMGRITVPAAAVRADATFESTGILPGSYRLTSTAPAGFWLRSAVVNGKDVLDVTLEFAQTDIADAVLTFTDRHSELSGTLQTASGGAAPDYAVVVFPVDRMLWIKNARRIQTTRPATDGKFLIRDLPGGDYFLAALDDVDPADLTDPIFLEAMVASSVKVAIVDGEKKQQDLRIAR